jgi:hypothetical protein
MMVSMHPIPEFVLLFGVSVEAAVSGYLRLKA